MNYQFAPFRVGVSDVTQEELEKAKATVKEQWFNLKAAAIDLSIAAAEVSLRYTVDGMQAATYKLADVHDVVAAKLTAHRIWVGIHRKVTKLVA